MKATIPNTPRQAAPEMSAPPGGLVAPQTVLLAVTGMSPAVLTETLWALAHETPPVIPERVIAVTTSAGRERLRRLFDPLPLFGGLSPWDALRQSLQACGHSLDGRLRFGLTADVATGRSRELEDLRHRDDNEAAADFTLEQVRSIVENPDTHLIASVAGGRKTMGALLYACLTLAGRETDRLTHVLVSEPFETLPDFYFPAQPGGPLAGRNGEKHPPSGAAIELAEVPFVPLRNLFIRELGRRAGTFSRLVEECREQVRRAAGENIQLSIFRSRPDIDVNGTPLRLSAREHLLLLFLAGRARQQAPVLRSYGEAVDPANQFREDTIESAPPDDFADIRHHDSLRQPFTDDQDLRKLLSSIRTKLKKAGGNAPLLVPCLPEHGRFSLTVPGPLIHIK